MNNKIVPKNIPTKSGFYWYKLIDEWAVVKVNIEDDVVQFPGVDYIFGLKESDSEWGDIINPPD